MMYDVGVLKISSYYWCLKYPSHTMLLLLQFFFRISYYNRLHKHTAWNFSLFKSWWKSNRWLWWKWKFSHENDNKKYLTCSFLSPNEFSITETWSYPHSFMILFPLIKSMYNRHCSHHKKEKLTLFFCLYLFFSLGSWMKG